MYYRIVVGIGTPGKLWTGTPVREQQVLYARPELVEFWSPQSGACTRRLFLHDVKENLEGLVMPTLHIFSGGVGSLVGGRVVRERGEHPTTPHEDDAWLMPLLVWNWSGRVGGYIVVDPLLVESGYVSQETLNSAKPGYAWIKTYYGTTLSEFVLVKTNQVDPNEFTTQPAVDSVDDRHVLPVTRYVRSLLAPPEREVPQGTTEETEA